MQLGEAHRIEVLMSDDKMEVGAIAPASIDAVAGGYCHDPFAILGPHAVPSRDAWRVRAFLPGRPAGYQLQTRDWHGATSLIDDAYRFGTIITSFDLHLHSEGKLYESWNTMGAHCMTVDGVAGVRFAVWAPNAETVSG